LRDSPSACEKGINTRPSTTAWEIAMGKYFLGWILGVPVIVLVVIYLVMH
jgi:hypothetical protein